MINYNTLGQGLKRGIINFSKKVSKNVAKPKQKFTADMIYGIIASGSSKLTDIGKQLKERTSLKKVSERLGRHLKNFSDTGTLMDNYIEVIRPSIGENTMILIDPSDVVKPSSPKMEGIGKVYDASKQTFGNGYWTIGAVALTENHRQPIPVYEKLYPCKEQGGSGSKFEMEETLQFLRKHFNKDIPRVIDRGFDSGGVIKDLMDNEEKFIIRVNQNRAAIHGGQRTYIDDVVKGLVCAHGFSYKNKTDNKFNCKIGITQVVLPNLKNAKLNLVVVKGLKDNLALYTNLDESIENIAERVVKAYLMRWRIEEYYEFKKQKFNFEDFRVRSLKAIQSLNILLTIAAGYIAVLSDKVEEELYVVELIAIAGRSQKPIAFIRKKKFFLYAIYDGIQQTLAYLKCGISGFFDKPPISYQLSLFAT